MARDRRPARPKAFAQAIATPAEVNMRFTNVNIRYIWIRCEERSGQAKRYDTSWRRENRVESTRVEQRFND